jgi:phage terminase small subunit
MSTLTAKQERFALRLAEGETQADAYRHVYRAHEMGSAAVWSEASRLAHNPKVAARVQELKAEAEERRRMAALDREEAILNRLEHEALTARTDGARVKALELLGKHLGMFTDRVVVEPPDRTEEEIEQAILMRLARLGAAKSPGTLEGGGSPSFSNDLQAV